MLGFSVFGDAGAAGVNLPGAVQPGRDRPTPEAPTEPDVQFHLESTQRSPVPRAADSVHFQLKDIHILGSSVFTEQSFRPLFQNLIDHDTTLSNILDVADKIEAKYRSAGYALVRAFVPPQRVKDGVFTIKIVEGFVSSVAVEGVSGPTRDQTMSYLQNVVNEKPLELNDIERGLLLANDLPGVTAVGTLKARPDVPGSSELIVSEDQPWVSADASVNNRGSHFSGIWTANADVQFNGLVAADQLNLGVTTSPDASEQIAGRGEYKVAIGPDGLIGSVFGVYTHGEPGSTLAEFDVLTDSWATGTRLTYPVIRSRAFSLNLNGGFAVQDAQIFELKSMASHDQWRVADIGFSALGVGQNGSESFVFDLAQGLPILGATHDNSPELSRVDGKTDFTKFTANGQIIRTIVDAFSVAVNASGQYSFSPLITGEQVSYGGTAIGRGYDPGATTGDDGIGGSLEFRYDFHNLPWGMRDLEPYVYGEGARTWFRQPNTGLEGETLRSIGGGIRFALPYRISGDIEGARTLTAVPDSDGGRKATKVLMDVSIAY
jgi:hemolysin activation/secretion protein